MLLAEPTHDSETEILKRLLAAIHALRDASKAIFEQDRKAKLAVRQKLQPKLRQYRSDLAKRKVSANECERAQYDVLDRYEALAQKGALLVAQVNNGSNA